MYAFLKKQLLLWLHPKLHQRSGICSRSAGLAFHLTLRRSSSRRRLCTSGGFRWPLLWAGVYQRVSTPERKPTCKINQVKQLLIQSRSLHHLWTEECTRASPCGDPPHEALHLMEVHLGCTHGTRIRVLPSAHQVRLRCPLP